MSSFEEKAGADTGSSQETKPETKTEDKAPEKAAEIVVEPLKSRVFEDKKLWEQSDEYATMLSYCRPHNSKTEAKFISRYIVPLGVAFDKKGNAYKQIGDKPSVLWSSHIDTVHNGGGIQKIEYYISKAKGELHFQAAAIPKTNCLGADDTAGIWLMMEMIRANIPGLYIFHRGEEVGRIGSKWIAEHNPVALAGIKFAIAFDRKAEKSIITYQSGSRCCSDEFAKSLADQLGMGHECDTGGSYTDTASYVDLIAECTNVSAGYINAHCHDEKSNVDYLFRLRDALLKIDLSKLVEKRKPGENTKLYQNYTYSGGNKDKSYDHHDEYYWNWRAYQDQNNRNVKEGFTYGELCKKHKSSSWQNMYQWDEAVGLYFKKKFPKDPTGKGITIDDLRKKHKEAWWQFYEFDPRTGLWFPKPKTANKKVSLSQKSKSLAKTLTDQFPQGKPTHNDMVRMIKNNPEIIADMLEQEGYTPEIILDNMILAFETGGTVHL